jgi:hypothetical protein
MYSQPGQVHVNNLTLIQYTKAGNEGLIKCIVYLYMAVQMKCKIYSLICMKSRIWSELSDIGR